jgi:hypothetical protein
MKGTFASVVFISLIIAAVARPGVAQTPSPPSAGQIESPPPPLPPPALGALAPAAQNEAASPSITGTVEHYLLTPVGDIEGLELADGTDARLPPHLGTALAAIVKPGDAVNVVGFVAPPSPYGRAIKALTITNVRTNQSVVDQPPTMPPPPPWTRASNIKQMTVSGKLGRYVLNDHGDIDGVILDNGIEVKFPPHIGLAVAMASLRQPSAPIDASGYGAASAFGTVVDAMTGSLSVGGRSIPVNTLPPPPPSAP